MGGIRGPGWKEKGVRGAGKTRTHDKSGGSPNRESTRKKRVAEYEITTTIGSPTSIAGMYPLLE